MFQNKANTEPASQGGLGVALMVFFVLGVALTLAIQTVFSRLRGPAEGEPVAVKPMKSEDLILPTPKLEPHEVVALQLKGLAKDPEAGGIEQCFALASPGNKKSTGPLQRFAAMLHRAPYNVLLFHHLVLVGKPVVEGDTANVIVTLLDANDHIFIFQFVLSKQHGKEFENCWMTDAVFLIQQIQDSVPRETPTAHRRQELESLTTAASPTSPAGPQFWGGVDG